VCDNVYDNVCLIFSFSFL